MNKRKNILKIFYWILWGAMSSGIMVLLVSAVSVEHAVTCKSVEIQIESDENLNMVTQSEIAETLWPAGSGYHPVGKKVSGFNLFEIEKQIEKNPWIADADVYFDHHRVMHIKVFQRTPVARLFLPDGSSIYLDDHFKKMPLKKSDVLALPVFTNFMLLGDNHGKTDSASLERIVSLAKYIKADEFWMAQVETVDIQYDQSFELTMQLGDEAVLLGKRSDWENLFPKLKLTYEKFARDQSWGKYSQINLQFKDQVVCKKRSGTVMLSDTLNKIQ